MHVYRSLLRMYVGLFHACTRYADLDLLWHAQSRLCLLLYHTVYDTFYYIAPALVRVREAAH